jgi:hypothetical protein
MLHQAEGHWVFNKEPHWVRAEMQVGGRLYLDTGVPAARYFDYVNRGHGGIVLSLGHVPGTPSFRMELGLDDAMQLIDILAAAVVDGRIAMVAAKAEVERGEGVEPIPPIPFVDVTAEPCQWRCCRERVL